MTDEQPAAVSGRLMDRLADALWLPDEMDAAQREAHLQSARVLLEEIAPGPGLEGLIAVQMVAAQMAAMDCIARAAERDAGEAVRDRALMHAEKLLALCARQTEVLGRHRVREARLRADRERAKKEKQANEEWRPRRIKHVFFDAGEWWAVRAHVIDPRIVLARAHAEADALYAGMDKEPAAAEGERAAGHAAADLPTVDGKPYIVDDRGMRHYPLPNGELAKVMEIDEEPFDEYFNLVRKRDGEEAERRAREISDRNDTLPNNPWRRDYKPKPQTPPKTNGAGGSG